MSYLKIAGICLVMLVGEAFAVEAQTRSNIGDTTVSATLVSIGYGFQFPFADMANRFGINNNIGAGLTFKFGKNWLLGAEFNFIFSDKVKEDTILNNLLTSGGNLIGKDGFYESITLRESGYSVMGKFGKIIPVFHDNPNSGLTLIAGIGFLQHKIKLDDANHNVPQVDGPYAKGYDRLTNGLAISQSIGYMHLDKRKLVNFSISVEALEGFTQNRRSWNFDQMKKDDSKRVDVLLGIKAAWIIPFYGSHEQKIYTY